MAWPGRCVRSREDLMPDALDKNAARIAALLNLLADVSGETAALEALRREADAFEPALSAAGVALGLLSLETRGEGRAESRARLVRLRERFLEQGELAAAERIAEGLRDADASEKRRCVCFLCCSWLLCLCGFSLS